MWLKRRREGREHIYPPEFPKLSWTNPELRKLVYFFGVTTVVNIVIGSQLGYSAVNYMDSVTFCGKTCHTVMQPEYHGLSELAAFARGMRQVPHRAGRGMVREEQALRRAPVARRHLQHLSDARFPTPVHNLRPARETCETCHWPQKYGEDRVRVINKFADDETNSLTKTVLLMKIGGGNHGIGIHGTHLGPGVHIRYAATDEQRQNIPWVEYNGRGRQTLYATADAKPNGGGAPIREMDCMDCHNRPAHSYDLPDRGIDKAMAAGLISNSLPFAKKKGVEILKANYLSRDEAAQKIPAAFAKYYQDTYPAICAQRQAEIAQSGKQLLEVWNRNIFPEMKVTWGAYPMNIGHTDFPGCFRCHDGGHNAKDGKSISQDCNACHNLLAMDEAQPKILNDLGIVEKSK